MHGSQAGLSPAASRTLGSWEPGHYAGYSQDIKAGSDIGGVERSSEGEDDVELGVLGQKSLSGPLSGSGLAGVDAAQRSILGVGGGTENVRNGQGRRFDEDARKDGIMKTVEVDIRRRDLG